MATGDRFGQLLSERLKAHPEEYVRIRELEDAHMEAVFKAEQEAVEYHGKVILAAITGKLRATPAGVPHWEVDDDASLAEILS